MKGWKPGRVLAAVATIALCVPLGAPFADSLGGPLGHRLVRPGDGAVVELVAGAPALHVVFFATWCPPCADELPRLSELEARWGERGYRLVMIAVQHRQTAERVEEFRREDAAPGEWLYDTDGTVQAASKMDGLPTHFVFDSAGREIRRSGALDDGVAAAIESLLDPRGPRGGR